MVRSAIARGAVRHPWTRMAETGMAETDGTARWQSGAFAIEAAPEHGGSIVQITWRSPDGPRGLFRPPRAPLATARPSDLGMFLMAPFTNRIDAARLPFEGAVLDLPLNRPAEHCSIHGFARDRPWRVDAGGPDEFRMVLDAGEPWGPYRCQVALTARADGEALVLRLAVTNAGERRLPFGFGFHPWFAFEAGATLDFAAAARIAVGDRGLPLAEGAVAAIAPGTLGSGRPAEPPAPCDLHFAGWAGTARIAYPTLGYDLAITATPNLGNLQVYVPPDRSAFCVEPVSHCVDVANRRDLAAHGDMTTVEPGATLAGEMRLAPTPA